MYLFWYLNRWLAEDSLCGPAAVVPQIFSPTSSCLAFVCVIFIWIYVRNYFLTVLCYSSAIIDVYCNIIVCVFVVLWFFVWVQPFPTITRSVQCTYLYARLWLVSSFQSCLRSILWSMINHRGAYMYDFMFWFQRQVKLKWQAQESLQWMVCNCTIILHPSIMT